MNLEAMKDKILQHTDTTVQKIEDAILENSRIADLKLAVLHFQSATRTIREDYANIILEKKQFNLEVQKERKALEKRQQEGFKEGALFLKVTELASLLGGTSLTKHSAITSAFREESLSDATHFTLSVLEFCKAIEQSESKIDKAINKLEAACKAKFNPAGGMGFFKDASENKDEAESSSSSQRQFSAK